MDFVTVAKAPVHLNVIPTFRSHLELDCGSSLGVGSSGTGVL